MKAQPAVGAVIVRGAFRRHGTLLL